MIYRFVMFEVWNSDLPSTSKLIMFAMQFMSHWSDCTCRASKAQIARIVNCSTRTIDKHLPALVKAGWLIASPQPGRPTEYQLTIPAHLMPANPDEYSTCNLGVIPFSARVSAGEKCPMTKFL